MTVTAKNLVETGYAPNSETTVYTASSVRAILDKVTVTNVTAGAVVITLRIVPQGGTAGVSNAITYQVSVAAGAVYLAPEMVGHVLNPGDFISVLAASASALVLRISGREIA